MPERGRRAMGYRLSVCIPNYNRPGRLERLVRGFAGQIVQGGMEREVEICIRDDCSPASPSAIIENIKREFPGAAILYERNRQNMGMDYNFLHSVRMAGGRYVWIVGNDDMPESGALRKIMGITGAGGYGEPDIIVTFDSYGYDGAFVGTVYPLGGGVQNAVLFDTSDKGQFHGLVMAAKDNSALFGFLSNVVFKRKRWLEHGDMFEDKMSSIFIQVYMNMQTLVEGAKYLYVPEKIIVNFLDDGTNQTLDRTYRIAAGLYDAMDYFFRGEERGRIEENVVDIFMAGRLLELPDTDSRRKKVDSFVSERMDMLRQYYVRCADRGDFFKGKPVVVYGAGKFGHAAVRNLLRHKAEIIGICDADKRKQGNSIQGIRIFGFGRLEAEYRKHKGCIVVVANNAHLVQIIKVLRSSGISRIAVIT